MQEFINSIKQALVLKQAKPFLTTNEAAEFSRCAAQTLRKNFCTTGHYHGIRPLKQPSGRLLWKLSDLEALINGGNHV